MCKCLRTAQLYTGRLTAGGIQQKRPQRIQTGHAVKQYDTARTAVQDDLLRIIIGRSAKHIIKRGQIFGQALG